MGPTGFETLGVEPTADPGAWRRAYRQAAFAAHPDRNPGDPTAAERFRVVRDAWETIKRHPTGKELNADGDQQGRTRRKIRVRMTEEHIREGVPGFREASAFALALAEEAEAAGTGYLFCGYLAVDAFTAEMWIDENPTGNGKTGAFWQALLPEEIREWNRLFDSGRTRKPAETVNLEFRREETAPRLQTNGKQGGGAAGTSR